jgi:hypothetical protein
MAKVIANKKINLFQLDQELGSQGLCSDENDPKAIVIVTAENSKVTEQQLKSAIDAHVALDPNAAKELAQTKLAALGLTTDDLKALGL